MRLIQYVFKRLFYYFLTITLRVVGYSLSSVYILYIIFSALINPTSVTAPRGLFLCDLRHVELCTLCYILIRTVHQPLMYIAPNVLL